MALEDLDLEFEDEEETKKSDAIDIDVDLSFSAAGEEPTPASKPTAAPKASASVPPKPAAPRPAAPKPAQQKPAQTIPKSTPAPGNNAPARANNPAGAQVKNLDEARRRAQSQAQGAAEQQRPARPVPQKPTPKSSESNLAGVDYQQEMNQLKEELNALKDQMNSIKREADVRVAVAEAKTEYVVEFLSNAKLMDHQVNLILQKIHGKVPQLKNEILAIKQYMGEFIKKSSDKK
ncbi:MAG: hypothetical protein KC478_13905 [Bacteriovoracaceae bacterium]|nr:hypothetical protein [Bacteriovoracaceae bacterium]